MDCSTPGFPVHRHLPELAQTHVHRVSDAIQPPAGRHLTRSSEISGFHKCGHATGIEWVEASDAAESPLIPVLKSYPASNTSSAVVEKP